MQVKAIYHISLKSDVPMFLLLHSFLMHSFIYVFFFRYEQSELIERELEQMTEQIKSIIHSLNSNQVKVVS